MTQSDIPDLSKAPDHGGGLDAAIHRFGGRRANWLDLSTGINPRPYPLPPAYGPDAWTALPDKAAFAALEQAAREFWQVPAGVAVLAAPGASALIARIPALNPRGQVWIPQPTYNEHARAFVAEGWQMGGDRPDAVVVVHPNNPDGRECRALPDAKLTVIDESFCDVMPEKSLIHRARDPGVIILKSFGKFWGLAGLRLGFAIGAPDLITRLAQMLGPWPVSGPALEIGARALQDRDWADQTRERLAQDASRLDRMIPADLVGGTHLFRLYRVENAVGWQEHLARHHIWTRIFPYDPHWLRFGLPDHPDHWARLATAVKDLK